MSKIDGPEGSTPGHDVIPALLKREGATDTWRYERELTRTGASSEPRIGQRPLFLSADRSRADRREHGPSRYPDDGDQCRSIPDGVRARSKNWG